MIASDAAIRGVMRAARRRAASAPDSPVSRADRDGRAQPDARCRRARGEDGAALIEFAFLVPVLLMIVFGAFSGASAYNNKQDIVYATREGARYGATIPQSQCSPTSNCGGKTWAQLVQSVVVARASGEVTTSDVCVALVSGSTGVVVGGTNQAAFTTKSDGTSSCYNDGNADTGARVQVSISHAGSINAVFLTISVTEASQATEHFEQ